MRSPLPETIVRQTPQQMMDLVFTIGQYNLVSWVLNSLGVPLDDYLPSPKKSVDEKFRRSREIREELKNSTYRSSGQGS